jgi:hypothetical protein
MADLMIERDTRHEETIERSPSVTEARLPATTLADKEAAQRLQSLEQTLRPEAPARLQDVAGFNALTVAEQQALLASGLSPEAAIGRVNELLSRE